MQPLDYVFAGAVMLSALCAPYTKVEESFYMQAIHDILKWGPVNSSFDHLSFPGAVPRSFVGPLLLAALSYPATLVVGTGGSGADGPRIQIAARLALGCLVAWANSKLRRQVGATFGGVAARWYAIFSMCQFHFTFWTSRMLGNTLALVPMLLAQTLWLRCLTADSRTEKRWCYQRMAMLLTCTCVILRFDTVVFAVAMLVASVFSVARRAVVAALGCFALSALLTVAIDSYFWRTPWMWPEFQAFWFNVVEDRSSEWGVSPPRYYFAHLLPKLLLGALPLACIGALADARASCIAAPYIVAIGIFSANPHKEWRFIFPAVPVFNICAAAGMTLLYRVTPRRQLVTLTGVLLAAGSLAATVSMTLISSLNYPGGHALAKLHNMEHASGVRVHIDSFAAMTGVARFGQIRGDWVYDKTEGLQPGQFGNFTHLITSTPDLHYERGFLVIGTQLGYAGLRVTTEPRKAAQMLLSGQLPVAVQQAPMVWIMSKNSWRQGNLQ